VREKGEEEEEEEESFSRLGKSNFHIWKKD
jgi:hypothetical protein